MKRNYTEFDYTAKIEELESILVRLQSVDISLDKALALHKAGKSLTSEIEDYLKHAENEVNKQIATKG